MDIKKFFQSSQDPKQVSTAIKGAILGFTAVIMFVAKLIGIPFTETDLVNLATQIGLAGGALIFAYGLIMKIVMFFAKEPEDGKIE